MKFQLRNCVLILLVGQIFSSSCTRIILNNLGAFENKISLKYITNGENKLIFVPMHHIGKKVFYDDAKKEIDSLITVGYMVYFEKVSIGVEDSMQKDTLFRKVRKITGVDFPTTIANRGYIDTINNTLFGKKTQIISKYKLVNQPRNIIPISDTLRVRNVDASFSQLISACENKYGAIVLEQYDYEIKFGEKYKAKRNKEMLEYFLAGYRNILITDSILKDPNKKIILIYGSKHFSGILENLKMADKKFKQVEKL
ncbi:MAG: hypothetical protein ABI741_00920 [Ferruginibacter sp.]